MSKIESYNPGSFCWAELATTDLESAKKFYAEMFGWIANDMPMPEGVYTIFQVDGNDAAAMYTPKPDIPPHWGVYFSVANVDESAANVGSLGGKVIAGPFDVSEFGRSAVVQDPQGTVFQLWEPKAHIGARHGGPFSMVTWPELATPDPEGAIAFYTGLFGWRTRPETGIESAQYVELINGQEAMGGLLPMRGPEWAGIPSHFTVYITVPDCDERTAKAKELGATVCVPPETFRTPAASPWYPTHKGPGSR